MKPLIYLICLLATTGATAVQYEAYEINQQLNQTHVAKQSTALIQNYFSSSQPNQVVDDLLQQNMSPLVREYMLNSLLTEISQQPPQDFHQAFVDRMKQYPAEATKTADEGHLPVPIFNLNSKAHGIENIWTAYRTEQRFIQLFKQDLKQAVNEVQDILSKTTTQRRPQWLGVKNSISALDQGINKQLGDYLMNEIKLNSGMNTLISHVGLQSARLDLIEKALKAKQTAIRQLTLRKLTTHLSAAQAKSLLIDQATTGDERAFSTALLGQFKDDANVESFLIKQLNNNKTAANAAFALSQSDNINLPEKLKAQYLKSANVTARNHLLLALKLNKSDAAQLALADLMVHVEKHPHAAQWLKSFEHNGTGEQR